MAIISERLVFSPSNFVSVWPDQKYKVVIAGHSLGAGVASLFTLLEHARVPAECELRCVGFATPACCDATLADYGGIYVVLSRNLGLTASPPVFSTCS